MQKKKKTKPKKLPKSIHNQKIEIKNKEQKDAEFTREITEFHTPPSEIGSPVKKSKDIAEQGTRKRSKNIDISQMTITELAKIDTKRALDELNKKYQTKKIECKQLNSVLKIVSFIAFLCHF